MGTGYLDRRDAGCALAECLLEHRNGGALVLALPGGGIPVAYEIAIALGLELDVLAGDRPLPDVSGRPVLLVDDGIATGSTMLRAIDALRQLAPRRITVVVPVASPDAFEAVSAHADDVVCPFVPPDFHAVGWWYREFGVTSDAELRTLLARARSGPVLPHAAWTHTREVLRLAAAIGMPGRA